MIESINNIGEMVIYRHTEKKKSLFAMLSDCEDVSSAIWMTREDLSRSSGLPLWLIAKVDVNWISVYDTELDEIVGFFPNIRATTPHVPRLKDTDIGAIGKQLKGKLLHVKGYMFCRVKSSGSHRAISKWAKQSLEGDILKNLLYRAYIDNKRFSKAQRVELIELLK